MANETALEERVARVEGRLEEMHRVFATVERVTKLDSLPQEVQELRIEVRELGKEMMSNFRWLVGIQLTIWITVMLALAGLYLQLLQIVEKLAAR